MCNHTSKSGVCEAGINCYDVPIKHLCSFCMKYGHKKVFTDKEEKEIENFLNKNKDLMQDLADGGD